MGGVGWDGASTISGTDLPRVNITSMNVYLSSDACVLYRMDLVLHSSFVTTTVAQTHDTLSHYQSNNTSNSQHQTAI